jgi:hypothetical protein
MSDELDIGDTATSFNDATQTGLDNTAAAAESGIDANNAYNFSQGPDGNLGSTIPGAGGVPGDNGWNTVDYNQPAVGVDAEPPVANFAGSVYDTPANTGFQGQTDEFGGLDTAIDTNSLNDFYG